MAALHEDQPGRSVSISLLVYGSVIIGLQYMTNSGFQENLLLALGAVANYPDGCDFRSGPCFGVRLSCLSEFPNLAVLVPWDKAVTKTDSGEESPRPHLPRM
jgi:hypothetical protein